MIIISETQIILGSFPALFQSLYDYFISPVLDNSNQDSKVAWAGISGVENKRESSVLTSVESRFPGSDRSDFNESVFMFLLRVQNRL